MNKERYSNIDQLRFLAAITVAISHLIISHHGSNLKIEIISSIAVEVFFIISGFVLASQILKVAKSGKIKDYKVFLMRRWYRTIPLYVLSLILTSIILNKIFTVDFIKYLFFVQNFIKILVDVDYFSISWSLSVEEWFYIIFPLFLILLSKFLKNVNEKKIIISTIFFITIIVILRLLLITDSDWGLNVRRIVLLRLDSIAYGFILFFFKDNIKFSLSNIIILFLFFFLFSISIFKILEINAYNNILFFKLIFHFVVAVWGSLMVIIFYILDKKLKNNNLINFNLFLGKISYSIYLFHLMTIYIISPLYFSLQIKIIIFLTLQIIISSILYFYFEKPILKLRPNYY